jgi:hypothetical protein
VIGLIGLDPSQAPTTFGRPGKPAVPLRRLAVEPAAVRALVERLDKMPLNGDGARLCTRDEAAAIRAGLRALSAVLREPVADAERLDLWRRHLGGSSTQTRREGWRQLTPADHAALVGFLHEILSTYTMPPTR